MAMTLDRGVWLEPTPENLQLGIDALSDADRLTWLDMRERLWTDNGVLAHESAVVDRVYAVAWSVEREEDDR